MESLLSKIVFKKKLNKQDEFVKKSLNDILLLY